MMVGQKSSVILAGFMSCSCPLNAGQVLFFFSRGFGVVDYSYQFEAIG